MGVYLIIVEDNSHLRVEITSTASVLGRSGECRMIVKDPLVNEKHCSFLLLENKTYLTDLKSSEGTFVNDRPFQDGFIHIGDRIRVGNVALFLDPQEMDQAEREGHTLIPAEETREIELEIERPGLSHHPDLDPAGSWRKKLEFLLNTYLEEFSQKSQIPEKALPLLREIKEGIIQDLLQELAPPDPLPRKENVILDLTSTSTKLNLEKNPHKKTTKP